MSDVGACPRCGGPVTKPPDEAAGYICAWHGEVPPLQPFRHPDAELLESSARDSREPFWVLWPPPAGWVVTGVGRVGERAEAVRATVVALGGPNPLGGAGELLIVAEEPGIGLGARYAGLLGPDPGVRFGIGAPDGRVLTDGHPTPLWYVETAPDRAAYAGEAAGRWLWLIFHPGTAGTLLVENLELADARVLGPEVRQLSFGALTPRVTEQLDEPRRPDLF